MTLWLAVTADKYELPIAVADTGAELGRMLGIKHNLINKMLCMHNKGQIASWKKYKIIKLENIDDSDMADILIEVNGNGIRKRKRRMDVL